MKTPETSIVKEHEMFIAEYTCGWEDCGTEGHAHVDGGPGYQEGWDANSQAYVDRKYDPEGAWGKYLRKMFRS